MFVLIVHDIRSQRIIVVSILHLVIALPSLQSYLETGFGFIYYFQPFYRDLLKLVMIFVGYLV